MGFHGFIRYDDFTRVRALPAGPRHSERQMNEPVPPPVFNHDSTYREPSPLQNLSPELLLNFTMGWLRLKEIVHRQYALIGRGTCVVRGEVKDGSDLTGKGLTVKITLGYPLRQNNEHILGHIPQVLLHQDYDSTAGGPRGKWAFDNDDHRVLHVIVMHNYFPISKLHTSSEDNRVIGVLIDFDLAVFITVDLQDISIHLDRRFHTGTLPFMAVDLLDETDKIHWVRRELELFLWVMVWYTARYHEGIETTMAFQICLEIALPWLAKEKSYLLNKPDVVFNRARVDRKAKREGGQTSEVFDMETLGNRIT
ncbi:hypothetical protein BS47DRAFT_1398578 [Hydnum rufescens UP504]|uniref:Fungal-type protein kinase domain-containing protein n=1 Tax=Hydnum rufescens UP504 TaxID=1448309 RepID=A0A9P6AKF9_9AGAM|nr:hypothetical protein BS47DRAFT_1398578 [Hydnum rufescens UP504]